MACTPTSSFPFACRDGNGGVLEMKVKAFNASASGSTLVETSGTVVASGSSLTGWYTLYCEKLTANFDETGTTSTQNGTSTYKDTVNFIFNKLQAAFRNELKIYHQTSLHICVKDNNGVAWIFGLTRGMDLVTSKSSSGTNYEDRSGYVLTFEGTEPAPMLVISNYASLITA